MSWELASFLVLAAAIVAGFAWYERSRPPAQVVALVASLAALATAGRIAFAAFPNVKPTTDIVIFAGFALGPAPGFAVGALTGLASNFWFGQGPWTPWQMAAWGLCGVLGAALALGGRNVGRLTLASVCGLAGVAYGVLLNFSLMATYGGELSWQRFGALETQAIPFDAAHTVGNIAFALLAGPAMIRMLMRFRERFEWDRGEESGAPERARLAPGLRGGGLAALLLTALALGALSPARADAADVARAANWLEAVENRDGGFGASKSDRSDAAMTCWAMLGLEAAGRNPLDVSRDGRTPVDFLRSSTGELTSPGDLARTIVALEGAGVDPRGFGGENLVAALNAKRRDNGSYEGWPGSTAFAVIALRTAGVSGGIEGSLSWLRKVQNDDGGWGDVPGSPSTSDGTGAVLQALSGDSKAAHRGLSFLREAQHRGGGYPLGGGGEVNTQSTAWAIQGIVAADGDPASYRRGGASAPEYLSHQQEPDGHFRYSKSSDQTPIWVTGEVLAAAAGRSFPISPPKRTGTISKSKSLAETGGIAPGSTNVAPSAPAQPPAVPPGLFPAPPSGPSGGSAGGGAGPPAHSPPGSGAGAGSPEAGQPGGRKTFAGGSDTSATETSSSDGSSSTTGALFLGLGAGALLFGAAWGGRRIWLRQRYGL